MVVKTISITKEQEDWIEDNDISLSKFVQKKIQEAQNATKNK